MMKQVYKVLSAIRYFREDVVNQLLFKITGVAVMGKPKNIRGIVTIRSGYKGSITIGSNVTIMSGKKYNIIGNDFRTVFRTLQNGEIILGNNVGIANSTIVSASSVTIEDNVMIGGNCQIFDTDFHPIAYSERMEHDAEGGKSKPIRIREGAFIGANSMILKGVTIGRHSVIGAGSVVAKDIPDGEIWRGNPAVYIGKVKE